MFFIGMVALVLGLLIVVYDLPQVAYVQSAGVGGEGQGGGADPEVIRRIQAELYAGAGIAAAGAAAVLYSGLRAAWPAKK